MDLNSGRQVHFLQREQSQHERIPQFFLNILVEKELVPKCRHEDKFLPRNVQGQANTLNKEI